MVEPYILGCLPARSPQPRIYGLTVCTLKTRMYKKEVVFLSKKKRRNYKRKNSGKKPRVTNAVDKHHLCWTRRSWNHGSLKELRLFHYCIVPLPRDTLHRFLHSRMCFIPVPRERSAKYALQQLRYLDKAGAISDDDPVEKRLDILAALFDCIEQPTANAFRKQKRIICEFKNCPL